MTALYSFLLLPLLGLAAAFASTASGKRLGLGANSTFDSGAAFYNCKESCWRLPVYVETRPLVIELTDIKLAPLGNFKIAQSQSIQAHQQLIGLQTAWLRYYNASCGKIRGRSYV